MELTCKRQKLTVTVAKKVARKVAVTEAQKVAVTQAKKVAVTEAKKVAVTVARKVAVTVARKVTEREIVARLAKPMRGKQQRGTGEKKRRSVVFAFLLLYFFSNL